MNIHWFSPIFINAGGWPATIGLSNENVWFVNKKKPEKIGEGNSGTLLLPLMQEGYGGNFNTAHKKICDVLSNADFSLDYADTFPYCVPVETAFKYKMSKWAEMAVDWLSYIDMDYDLALMIFDFSNINAMSQKKRQQALKTVNTWAIKRGYCFLRKR